MVEASRYRAIETLRDGRSVEVRALRPEDRGAFAEAVTRIDAESLRLRFFAPKRTLTDDEISFFVNVDFVNHVALVAVAQESGWPNIVGGGRYIVVDPGRAEVAFTVADHCQGQGLAAALLRHLAVMAREAGLRELTAEVLAENTAMLRVFEKSGLRVSSKRERSVVHVILQLG